MPLRAMSFLLLLALSTATSAADVPSVSPAANTQEVKIQQLLAERERDRQMILSLQSELDKLRPLAREQQTAEQLNEDGLKFYERGDYEAATPRFRQAAELGNPAAMTNLALAYLNGRGVPPDIRQAEQLLVRASAQGHMPASENLAKMYEMALGVHFDRSRAIQWYLVAERQGSPIAAEHIAALRSAPRR